MKKIALLGLTLLLLGSMRAYAQTPNSTAEHNWQTYLSRHPGLAEHPQLLNNPTYLHDHPGLAKWLRDHPAVAAQARREGMWDRNGRWHDSSWWHQHNPNLLNQNHPEWVANHPEWRGVQGGPVNAQSQGQNGQAWPQAHPAAEPATHPGWREHKRWEAEHHD